MKVRVCKNGDFFCNCGSNNWETVVDRRVHAAKRFYIYLAKVISHTDYFEVLVSLDPIPNIRPPLYLRSQR